MAHSNVLRLFYIVDIALEGRHSMPNPNFLLSPTLVFRTPPNTALVNRKEVSVLQVVSYT